MNGHGSGKFLMSLFFTSSRPLREGGIRELSIVSLPFIFSAFSTALMLFFDRLFLANYSLDALNASVNAGSVAVTFFWSAIVFGGIAEVFVAQYVGAGLLRRLGEPVWQMIWFSLLTGLLFVPLALFAEPLCRVVGNEEGADYFALLMFFGPLVPLNAALSAFFIGQRRLRIVMLSIILANALNVALDVLLIFGVPGKIPQMGIRGAAWATICAQSLQAVVLTALFLKRKNRECFGTTHWRWQSSLFFRALRIASPYAASQTIEPFAWALYFGLLTIAGKEHITIGGICQSVYLLLACIVEGMSKGVATLVGNFLGARRWEAVWRVFHSGIKFYALTFCLLGLLLILYPEWLIALFLPEADDSLANCHSIIRLCFFWTLIYLFLDGIRYTLAAMLTAAGDTLVLSMISSLTVWVVALLPVYLSIVHFGKGIVAATFVTVLYNAVTCVLLYARVRKEKWKQSVVLQTSAHQPAVGIEKEHQGHAPLQDQTA